MADQADVKDTPAMAWLKDKLGLTGKEPASANNQTAQQAADAASSNGPSDDGKIGRMKQAQSTDRDNSYSY